MPFVQLVLCHARPESGGRPVGVTIWCCGVVPNEAHYALTATRDGCNYSVMIIITISIYQMIIFANIHKL